MSEYPSEKEPQEVRELREMTEVAAEYRAMPLRTIRSVEHDGRIARLDCGHRKTLLVWLRDGDSVRCRECFNESMARAERMIEG